MSRAPQVGWLQLAQLSCLRAGQHGTVMPAAGASSLAGATSCCSGQQLHWSASDARSSAAAAPVSSHSGASSVSRPPFVAVQATWHQRSLAWTAGAVAGGCASQRSSCAASLVEHGTPQRRVVAVAVSGGVDSAVAAMHMQQAGHEVFGVFMRNWDETEEVGNQNCSVEADFQDARRVCEHLGMPLLEADFVSEYWHCVFQPFLDMYARGLTPNPDLACNRAIKFDALLRRARSLGADTLATGHYAQLRSWPEEGRTQLLRGADPLKDQSYFLATLPQQALAKCAFPLGGLHKEEVRRLATAAAIPTADKRSSAGICFIGRRKFGDFLTQYMEPVPGLFADVDRPGEPVGACPNMLAVTHGQRAGIGGAADRMYVVGKDMKSRKVFAAEGADHPALFTRTALLSAPSWIAGAAPAALAEGRAVRWGFKARYRDELSTCSVQLESAAQAAGSAPFKHSSRSRCLEPPSVQPGPKAQLRVVFDNPARAITPGQEFVLYDGEVCLGAAAVAAPGPSLAEERDRDARPGQAASRPNQAHAGGEQPMSDAMTGALLAATGGM